MADPITNSVVGIAGSVLNKFVADKNLKMKLEHELKTQLQTANLSQIEVNKIEAASKTKQEFFAPLISTSPLTALLGPLMINFFIIFILISLM